MDVFVARKRLAQSLVARVVGQHPQFDLRVVGRQQRPSPAAPGTKAERISRPSSVRTGMFCRFGSLELSRPVAVTTWLNEAWTRPVSGWTISRQGVDVGALELGVLPVLDDLGRQRVLRGQLLQHVDVGARAGLRVFLTHRQLLLDEQHLLQAAWARRC